ncbi:MAG: hypothetical protein AAGA08_09860 [Pseudomonadota bacterium]
MTGLDGPEKDDALDALLSDLGRRAPQPSDALIDRIVADAKAEQPQADLRKVSKQNLWSQIVEALGGWAGLGGLVTATAAGVYIGFVQPDLMQFESADGEEAAFTAMSLLPDDDLFFDEG